MRLDLAPLAPDAKRAVTVTRHPTATWAELLAGTAADGEDLTPYVGRLRQADGEASVTLHWAGELYGAAQPVPGDLVVIASGGATLWTGCVAELTDYREERGTRTLTLTVRSRDTLPAWRNVRWATDAYPLGTDLAEVARDVLAAVGLGPTECLLPPSGRFTPHRSTQLSDLTALDMLETLGLPLLCEPATDALGRFRWRSRDVTRPSDAVLTQGQVLSIRGGRRRPPLTHLTLKWLDPALTRSVQQEQVLATETVTAGFFKPSMGKDVYFGDDRRQRAQNTWCEVKESINAGLIPFATEAYSQEDDFHGRLSIENTYYVAGLATAGLVDLLTAAQTPDNVVTAGAGASTGYTIPVGRVVEMIGTVEVLYAMLCLGTGVYEIRGQPFDFVHSTNRTEAYDEGAAVWERREEQLANDYVADETHAQEIAVHELLYRSLAGTSWGAELVDLPGLETGDILELPDGARLYVTGFSRDLSRGAPATVSVEGFRC